MSKYNTKAEGVKPTVVNAMGENAYQLSAKEELVSTCMTTFLSGDHYYETEKEVKIDLRKISGHDGHLWNELADGLATGKITAEEVLKKYGRDSKNSNS